MAMSESDVQPLRRDNDMRGCGKKSAQTVKPQTSGENMPAPREQVGRRREPRVRYANAAHR